MKSLIKISSIFETDTSFVFENCYSMYVELNKHNGDLINSNLDNNEKTQKLFKALYLFALEKKQLINN